MNKISIIIALTLVFLGVTQSRKTFGTCPTFTTKSGFTLASYLGTWYEYQRDRWTWYELNSDCTTATYSLNSDGSVAVKNRCENNIYCYLWRKIQPDGKATCSGAECKVTFSDAEPTNYNYNVIDTDYTSYAVVYSCR